METHTLFLTFPSEHCFICRPLLSRTSRLFRRATRDRGHRKIISVLITFICFPFRYLFELYGISIEFSLDSHLVPSFAEPNLAVLCHFQL